MSEVGQKEIITQKRVVELFKDTLGFFYLGDWKDRENNSNVELELLTVWLKKQGHTDKTISKALHELEKAKTIGGSKTLYEANKQVYGLLRYGIKVRPEAGEHKQTICLIDWKNPHNNDFAIAEEVTIIGQNTKRPDVVLYVNGIALGVIELKRSTVTISEGIRQNLDNQKKEFIQPFFATNQLVMAGNDTEGLRYAVIETKEKYWLTWKEESPNDSLLDRGLEQVCNKERLLEIIHDFMVFDAGIKKVCRPNQYFGVRAAQIKVKRREGGIIWHTQGSGKSLTMVWLAKWIRENITDSRVLIITDRTELDEQIERVFQGVNEDIYRTKSGDDLVQVLNKNEEWLMCSLIHKFGRSEEDDINHFIDEVKSSLPTGFHAKGELFVFVDECHRTQSGKLHEAMKAILPGALLIGFTGTPLLKRDKKKSIEVFGPYIHTYKYDEAVEDGVVLDLRYEARDIDQNIKSQTKIDEWFEANTKGLTDLAKAQIKQRWGTMQKVLSSKDRLNKIVADILFDMETRDRLKSGHGNALLVCDSIYSACLFYQLFQDTSLAQKCAVITSYKPSPADIKGEETGEGMTEKIRKYKIYRKMLARYFDEPEKTAIHKADRFEKEVKKRFVKEPGQMKLLIVVDKLLTGFDAPPATYLYIDKNMEDHGLFQAICRVNRLDSDDKEYGYIIDYKDLFKSLKESINDYTGEAFEAFDSEDVEGLLKNRLIKGRERLEQLLERVKALCEPVEPPRGTKEYRSYFCGGPDGDGEILKSNEPKRLSLYKLVAKLVRAYANLANEMNQAGYSEAKAKDIKAEVTHYEKVREEVKLTSGDYINMKLYEPAMRHLLDTYIRAEDSEVVSAFNDLTLVEMIVEKGDDAIKALPKGIRDDQEAMAEAIENNVRKVIIDEAAVNPKYYENMSELLDTLIQRRRQKALEYKQYLEEIVALARDVKSPAARSIYPKSINTEPLCALYDNLDKDEELAVGVDTAVMKNRQHGWRGNLIKERMLRNAIREALGDRAAKLEEVFELVKNQRGY